MSRSAAPTGAKTRLMSEMKTLRKEKWINFEDVRLPWATNPHCHYCRSLINAALLP